MRVNINLASQKYEDVRQFYFRWGVAVAVLAVLTVLLATLAYLKHTGSTESARQTRELQEKVSALTNERARLIALENSSQNRDITQKKKYWNNQIAKRSFSWTQLLNEMQKIMPRRAFLDAVQPEVTPDNRVKVRLIISGEKREDARELVEKMENSTRFYSTRVVSENIEKEAKPGLPPTYKFEIESFYTPALPEQPPATTPAHHGQAELKHLHVKEGI